MRPLAHGALALILHVLDFATVVVLAAEDGYIGYRLEQHGDNESAVYETANTNTAGVELPGEPDVYLNASVSVQEISVEVDNITAKVNLDAQVLKLLHFTAGVDASIDRVKLLIQNVSAKVELEARLGNVVQMVNDVLDSIDLNPIVATLGGNVDRIINSTVDTANQQPASGDQNQKRDLRYNIEHNILYSVNDYSGHTHTNRVLAQNGSMYDVYLDNNGDETGRQLVGLYSRDMTFTGHNKTISVDGVPVEYEMQYLYQPYVGLDVVSLVYMDASSGKVTKTKVIAEAEGGGGSTISNDADQ